MAQHKSFVFFDCECANCFDGIGKICSLGYVLTDDELNVIESEDVIINPETDFDWYLLNPKNECHLAYSKDYFRAFPNFESYYKEIKKLFTTGNRYIAGYDVSNDVDFVNCACERYKQQFIQFRAFDLKKYLNKVYNTNKKLVEWAEFFECDVSSLKSHKSVDDAMMTMLILKKECEKTGKSAEEIFLEYKDFFVSNEQLLFQAEERKYKKELQDKLKRMYNKKAPQPRKNVFNGERFEFDKKLFTDLEFLLDFAKEIYNYGGVLGEKINGKGTVIFADDKIIPPIRQKIERRGLKIATVEEIQNKMQ